MEIELKNIKYEKNNELLLNDINITFQNQKITSIIGPSGSGKSLIGYLLVNLIKETDGIIRIDGKRNYDINKIKKSIGYVFEQPEICFFNKTVYEELSYSIENFNYKLEKKEKRISELLKIVGLKEEVLPKSPNELSSGEKELLGIALALTLNPKVIILDEPTVYLDSKNKKNLIKLLKKLKREYQKTIIVISNDINFIYEISDNIVLINNGEVKLSVNCKELNNYYKVLKDNNMEVPLILEFINLVREEKNINLNSTNDINELIKEIYRNVR